MAGHGSHVSIDVIQLAQDNDIHLLCLPAHTTHTLQPFDVNFSNACTKNIWQLILVGSSHDQLASLVLATLVHGIEYNVRV
jgi:hypothetical protein